MMEMPPLSLYVHFPWCVRKCPYCDFNSHPAKGSPPEAAYLDQLLRDLDRDAELVGDRRIESIFVGGGTPSLISGHIIAALLAGIRARIEVAADAEVTLEANPGAIDATNFVDYRSAGVNRLSIGAQSFDPVHLKALGRIHDADDTQRAVSAAIDAGFERVNLDLMHGLPAQTAAAATSDLEQAIGLGVSHISWYQLTIEPRTEFAAHPPALPDEDTLSQIETSGLALLDAAGFSRYEVSAFSRPRHEALHNLNYWMFGDYVGIGAGAHGKLSFPSRNAVIRTGKPLAPARYLETPAAALRAEAVVAKTALPGEFLLNALRLPDGVAESLFHSRTGLATATIAAQWQRQQALGLMRADRLAVTPLGLRFLDSVVSAFL